MVFKNKNKKKTPKEVPGDESWLVNVSSNVKSCSVRL